MQLSAHFADYEFKCSCCGKIKVEQSLVDKLEQLFEKLNCSKIIVNSGYRCPDHDKAVGGTSTGQHTKGTAADIVCYDQTGQIISSKKVCIAAQEVGFKGIANIDDTYTATHVDVRTSGQWYGNEIYGTGTVTDDFHKYFSKSDNFENESVVFGIDVSKWQGNINWSHVKADGVKFAIIRAGCGRSEDVQFKNNYAGCKSNGIPVGAYWYSEATTVQGAKEEAAAFISVLKGKTFEFPVYMDLEEKAQFALGKAKCSELVQVFCDELEKAGYYAGLYCSTYYLQTYISESVRNRYAVWVAQYAKSCTYTGNYGIWQHGVAGHPEYDITSKGSVYGISGQCDLDYCYIDYKTTIKKAGLNGFSVSESNDRANDILKDIKQVYDKYVINDG